MLRILNYHGVVDRATEGTHFSYLFTDIRDFEAQLARLTRVATPVSLVEIEQSIVDGHRLPDAAVHLSFDDGYRNNLVAAEILDRHRIPWSLFVVVDSVLDGYRPWYLRLNDAVRVSDHVRLPDGTDVGLATHKEKRRFAKQAKAEIMVAPDGDQDAAVAAVLQLPGMRVPSDTAWPALTPSELAELHRSGVEVGNHSARHRNLSRCGADDLHTEIVESRERLERHLGMPVRYFAYPDGRHSRRVRQVVATSHALALATWTLRSPMRPVALRRYEPLDDADLGTLLGSPEPQQGLQWAKWNLPWRLRELHVRLRPTQHRVIVPA